MTIGTTNIEKSRIEQNQFSNYNNSSQENNIINEKNLADSEENDIFEEKKRKHIEDVNNMINEEMNKRKKSHSQIYSWKSENGYRVYSNIGFPKDGNYTEPIVIDR